MTDDVATMLGWSARICSAGILIQSLELIRHGRHLAEGGVFGRSGAPMSRESSGGRGSSGERRIPGEVGFLVGRAALALGGLMLPIGSAALCWVLGALFGFQLRFNRRFWMVRENANAMYLICLGALVVATVPSTTERLGLVAAGFLTFQVLLAYFAAGKTKLVSPAWRSGAYLAGVLRDCQDRLPVWCADWVRRPSTVVVGTWLVIGLELLFPLCVFLPPVAFWTFIGGGLVFHAAITYVMGVHGFWWSFTATYPALFVIHAHLWPWVAGILAR